MHGRCNDQLQSVSTGGLLTQQTYGNGTTLNYSYDALDRLSAKWYNTDSYKTEYLYGDNGQLSMVLDSAAATRTKYIYDLADRIVGECVYNTAALNGNTLLSSTDYTFADATNYLTGIKYYANGLGTNTIGYRYGDTDSGEMPDQVYGVSWNGTELLSNTYDAFGRQTERSIALTDSALATDVLFSRYTYEDNEDGTTTTLVKRHATNHTHFRYYYDENGNITRIYDTKKFADYAYYTYDSLNQLVREDNKAAGYTYVYTYSGGNITSKTTYAYTRSETLGTALNVETWTYGNANWPDLLTGYSDGASTYTVSSDDLGNLTYIGSSSTNNTTHTWLGRLLESTTVTSGSTVAEIDYAYNGNGQRISKTVDDTTTKYYYNGDILAGMTIGSTPLTFLYDENGDYFGFTYGGATYYYIKNLQGDVIGITNESGTLIVQYSYDAWGKLLSVSGTAASTIGELNPIRYRSYYYDIETGYYYLNSRYYDPELCRFISADSPEILTASTMALYDKNLFSYCDNNPIVRIDVEGTCWQVIVGGIVVAALLGGAFGALSAVINGESVVAGGVTGAIAGGLIATVGLLSSTILAPWVPIMTGLVAAGADVGNQRWNYNIEYKNSETSSRPNTSTTHSPELDTIPSFEEYWDAGQTVFSFGAAFGSTYLFSPLSTVVDDAFKGATAGATNYVAQFAVETSTSASTSILEFLFDAIISGLSS